MPRSYISMVSEYYCCIWEEALLAKLGGGAMHTTAVESCGGGDVCSVFAGETKKVVPRLFPKGCLAAVLVYILYPYYIYVSIQASQF